MITFDARPELFEPILLVAFTGWNDAGDAASQALDIIAEHWHARPFAQVDTEQIYDYQTTRPQAVLNAEGIQSIVWPQVSFASAHVDGMSRDLVLLTGAEPNLSWPQFCTEVVSAAQELGVSQVILLGALLADAPHTRPVPVAITTTDAQVAERFGAEMSTYEGPTGIIGVLQLAFSQAGIPALSAWASLPHYVASPPNPKVTLALMRALEQLLHVELPTASLEPEAKLWQQQVDEMTRSDEDVVEYVEHLEKHSDAITETSGETLAQEFERYLRRKDQP